MIEDKEIKKLLEAEKLIKTADDFKKLVKGAQDSQLSLEDFLFEQKIINEETLYEKYAQSKELKFINLKDKTIRQDILQLIPEPIALNHEIIAFDADKEKIKIATLEPGDLQMLEFIKKKTNLEPEVYLTTPSTYHKIFRQYHKSLQTQFEDLAARQQRTLGKDGNEDKEKLEELAQDMPVVRIIDSMLEYAIFEEASDVHIEPADKEVAIRIRVDGILRNVMTLPKKIQPGLIARVKILSNLKLDEHRLPQDGRFKIETDEYKISFRVSVIPVFDGEKVVMRLLNESGRILSLEQLGLQTSALDGVKKNIAKPHGMILVTGPTGSGKTTTLYTILNILNKPEVNITTIEDPIEYRMPRINQSQVNPKIGYTFAGGLRAFLRQDPDIILVGEIRDEETAEISVNAAMTGHLLLSTLHTNDAATAVPRLQDMNIPSFLIASTTNVIIGQRLVRKICMNCIVSQTLEKEALGEIDKRFDMPELMKVLSKVGSIASSREQLNSLLFYKGKGCGKCAHTGYKGRIGIYEVLEVSPEIVKLIMQKANSAEIKKEAVKNGMITMAQDGFIKAKNGITTIEEILRVTKE
jgi:type IV pilus assembly protein PilB